MNAENCINRICLYYKQNKYDDLGGGKKMPNIQVAELFRWVEEYVDDYDDFYRQITKAFIPTLTTPFPLISHAEKYYVKPGKSYQPSLPKKTDDVHEYEHTTKYKSVKEIPLKNLCHDDFTLTSKQFLVKYGMRVFEQYNNMCGMWARDNDFYLINSTGVLQVPSGGYTPIMLEKYYNEQN